jgi:DNA-binding beta-propeller fold protein YncE
MTLRTPVFALAALVAACPPAVRAAVGDAAGSAVSVQVTDAPVVGRATPVVCSAVDPEGIATLTLIATGPDGVTAVIATAHGVSSVGASWTPAAPGPSLLRCEALSLSGATFSGATTVTVAGDAPVGPVITGVTAPGAAVLAGKSITFAVSATDPSGGALTYAWVASAGAIAPGAGAFATWTAPDVAGRCTMRVTVKDAAGLTATRTVDLDVVIATYEDAFPAELSGPRKLAATPEGELYVTDADGRLHRLTRRGERMSTALQGVTSVAAGGGFVFAALREGAVVQLDARTGRALARIELGMMQGPSGMAFDAARGVLWVAFVSGTLQARSLDGTPLLSIASAGTSALRRLVDVAIDPAGGVVYVAQDRHQADGTIYAFDAATGAFRRAFGTAQADRVRVSGGLAVAPDGRLFVSDTFSGKVQVLGADGALLGSLGTAGELKQPAGIALLPSGDLVVADFEGKRLARFGSGAPLATCPDDADCDGLSDAWELANGFDLLDPRDAVSDLDGDGLNETEEYLAGTNPRAVDSDGDGWWDRDEVVAGFDPLNGDDHRPALLASAPASTDPGLVRLSSSVSLPRGVSGDCTMTWEQIAGPSVPLVAGASAAPTFIARRAGAYGFRGVVSCGGVPSRPATVSVDVRNVPPRADAGRVVTVAAGKELELSGAFSSDGNGDHLRFTWDQIVGAPLAWDAKGDVMDTRPTSPGYYVFRLGASDRKTEGAGEVPVVVIGAEGVPTAFASSPVVASAGDRVILDASASFHGAAAAFAWTQVDGAPVALEAQTSVVAAFVPPAAGRYVFQVGIEEGGVRSPPARVEVYVTAPGGTLPIARVDAPRVVRVDAPVTLDGAGSSGSQFAWRQVSGPAAGLTDADRAVATVVPFEAGSHEFELVVSDGGAVGFPARVRLEARARGAPIPAAVAAAPATAAVGERVTLDARGSSGARRYRWTQVAGPWVVVEPGAVGAFTPMVPGVYGFELEVDDGAVRSAPARVDVMVFQNGMGN